MSKINTKQILRVVGSLLAFSIGAQIMYEYGAQDATTWFERLMKRDYPEVAEDISNRIFNSKK